MHLKREKQGALFLRFERKHKIANEKFCEDKRALYCSDASCYEDLTDLLLVIVSSDVFQIFQPEVHSPIFNKNVKEDSNSKTCSVYIYGIVLFKKFN